MTELISNQMIDWGLAEQEPSIIKVIGVGGGGGNAVNFMYKAGIKGVDFIICNTDNQHLLRSPIPTKIQIGYTMTAGRGVGGNPDLGRKAAEDNIDEIKTAIDSKTKMLFITSGMGGGTGTGAAPVIARLAQEMDLLTVGIVTYPFDHEGPKRKQIADEGIEEMRKYVDAMIVIYNQRLMEMHLSLPFTKAFAFVDNVCATAAKGIAEIITVAGDMNVDFEDVKTIMKNSGTAMFGSAIGEGENRAVKAVESALHSPLLKDKDIRGAQHILLNLSFGTREILMEEVKLITEYIWAEVGTDVDIKLGHCHDEKLADKLSVTLIATSFDNKVAPAEPKPQNNRVVLSLNQDEPVKNEPRPQKARVEPAPRPVRQPDNHEQLRINFNSAPQEDYEFFTTRTSNDESQVLKKYNYPILSPEDLVEKESVPAYIRKNIELVDQPHSSENEMSTFYLTDDPKNLRSGTIMHFSTRVLIKSRAGNFFMCGINNISNPDQR